MDAVKHLVLCQVKKRPPKLDLDIYPYLPKANVGTTSAASYMALMRGQAARPKPLRYVLSIVSSPCGCRQFCETIASWRANRWQMGWIMSSSLPV